MLVTVTFLDGQFGFLTEAPRACVSIGIANAGPTNVLNPITDKQSLTDTYVGGPLVEADGFQLANGTGTGYALRMASTGAGSTGTVTPTLKPGSAGALSISGTPNDSHRLIIVEITAAGLVAGPTTPSARISWDGGANFDPEFSIPIGGVYTPTTQPSGLTFNFTNGAGGFKTGDLFTFSATGPTWNSTSLVNALEALRQDEAADWEFFHVIGPASSAIFAVVLSELNLMRQDGRFAWALLEARDANTGETELQWMTAIKADFSASVAPQGQIVVQAGYGYLTSAISGRSYWRSLATTVAARVTNSADYAEHLGEIAKGPLPGIVKGPDGISIYHDERKKPGLAQARFLTIASVIGQKGYFIGDPATYSPATFAQPTSDYKKTHFMRPAIRTANLCMVIGSAILGQKIEVNRNGTINSRFASEKEQLFSKQLSTYLVPADLISVEVQIDRNVNIKTTGKVPVKVIMNSYAYAEKVDFTIAFLNPNLVTVV